MIALATCSVLGGCSSDPAQPSGLDKTPGSLDIQCLPHGLGAPWALVQPDQSIAVGYGDSLLNGLHEGEHLFIWGALPGWEKPQPDTLRIQVISAQTDTLVGAYEVPHNDKGKVLVFPEPVDLQVPWSISGQNIFTFRSVGSQELWLPIGDYTFSWGFVSGYIVPRGGPIAFTVQAGIERSFRGVYRSDSMATGTVSIDAHPDSLNASWTLQDPGGVTRTGKGDAIFYGMPVGLYSLTWLAGSSWDLPHIATQQMVLATWGNIAFRGDFLSREPLPIQGLEITNDFVPGRVEVSWLASDDLVSPIREYLVLVTPEQPGVPPDWDSAQILGRIDARGPGTTYKYSFGPESYLVPDIPNRYTVRGLDTEERLSPVRDSTVLTVESGFKISGVLTDHYGRPLAGIPLTVSFDGMNGNPQTVTTDAQGTFDCFSLWIGSVVHIQTNAQDVEPGAWYDYVTEPMVNGAWENMRLVLIPQRGVDPACPQYSGDFLTYFRSMTTTTNPTNNRSDTKLHKWDHFPLTVFIPDLISSHGFSLEPLCRTAIETWNDNMGEEFFVQVSDSVSSDVVFRFGTDNPNVNGETSLLEPQGNFFIGDVIPKKMEVYIAADMGIAQRIQEVALHEMGHVLGIATHSLCDEAGYLMYISSSGVLDNGPENAIHPDEMAMVRCLRYLPQGVNMAGYF